MVDRKISGYTLNFVGMITKYKGGEKSVMPVKGTKELRGALTERELYEECLKHRLTRGLNYDVRGSTLTAKNFWGVQELSTDPKSYYVTTIDVTVVTNYE